MSGSEIPYVAALDRHLVQKLSTYSACDISDALLKLKVPGAGSIPDCIPYSIPGRDDHAGTADGPVQIAPAETVLFIPKNDDVSGYPPSNIPKGSHWVDLSVTQPGSFVILSQPEGQKNAVLGGIMALRMQQLHASGVVVHGRVRDIDELKESGLMVWGRGTSTVGAGAESKPHCINIPITIAGITVTPGDVVFSDPKNGVVIIPRDKMEEVVELLPRLVQADDMVKQEVKKGMSVHEAFATFRKGL